MEAPTKIYHNPRCGKSRQALAILEEQGVDYEVIEYLKTPPTTHELKELLKHLGMKPYDLIRKGEKIFKEEYKGKELTDEQWIAAMVAHPILIERPIIIRADRGVVARPPELTNDIID